MEIRSKEEILNDTIKDYIANKFGYADWLQIDMVEFEDEELRIAEKQLMEEAFYDYKNFIQVVSNCL